MTWKKIGFYVVFALVVTVGVVLFSAPAYATPNEGVCAGLDSGKIDTTGDPQTVTVTAPAGKVIVEYCVKAGSIKQGNGPEYVVVDPGVGTITFGHSTGKAVSHYSVRYATVTTPDPVVKGHEESTCTAIDQYETHTWTTVDGVTTEAASSTRTLERDEAIELGCYTPPVLDCNEYQVPGWLNRFGDATSCVSNNPCPEVNAGEQCPSDVVPPVVTPVVTQEPAAELAETGVTETTLWALGIMSAVLVLFGTALVSGRRTG